MMNCELTAWLVLPRQIFAIHEQSLRSFSAIALPSPLLPFAAYDDVRDIYQDQLSRNQLPLPPALTCVSTDRVELWASVTARVCPSRRCKFGAEICRV
eukprot:Gb_36588 [translate_table: standard]